MDFQTKMKFTHPIGVPIPFFMAYPGYLSAFPREAEEEKKWSRDFEYLRQTYPVQVLRYQRRVEELLDKMDYEGSMIYDEYPDRLGLQSLCRVAAAILKKECGDGNGFAGVDSPNEETAQEDSRKENYRREDRREEDSQKVDLQEEDFRKEGSRKGGFQEEDLLEDLIQVLVCNEVCRRRHRTQLQ